MSVPVQPRQELYHTENEDLAVDSSSKVLGVNMALNSARYIIWSLFLNTPDSLSIIHCIVGLISYILYFA